MSNINDDDFLSDEYDAKEALETISESVMNFFIAKKAYATNQEIEKMLREELEHIISDNSMR